MDHRAWDERYLTKELGWGAGPNPFLVDAVAGLPVGEALDLACGQGRNAVWLATEGWEVTAVDWSEVGICQARALADEAGVYVDWRVADLVSSFPTQTTYQLVIVVYLQIPRTERHEVWRAAADAVTPGGRIVIIGHDSANLAEGYGGPQDADVLYTAAEVEGVIGPRIRVLRAERVPRMVETDEGVREAIDNIVVAS